MAERRSGRARNNVYTVLAGIACLAMVFGVVYVYVQIMQLTGEANPFHGFGAAPVLEGVAALGRATSVV